jgi:hypothetical protein
MEYRKETSLPPKGVIATATHRMMRRVRARMRTNRRKKAVTGGIYLYSHRSLERVSGTFIRRRIQLIPGEQTPLLPRSVRAPNKRPVPTYRYIAKLVLSAALLTLAGILLSSTTSSIADLLHITRSTAGLTILSIATTLPEKLVAFKSGRKAQAGVLVANTVGSNVFLLTLVLGVVWTAQGHMPMVEMGVWIWFDVGIVLVSSLVLFIIILSNALKRWMGSVMFGSYVLYIIVIFLR